MAHVLIMPRQGNTVESCIIGEWKVKEGDNVNAETPVCVVETDKATFEIPAGETGTVLKILHSGGDDVPVLQPIMVIGNTGENWENAIPKNSSPASAEAGKVPEEKNQAGKSDQGALQQTRESVIHADIKAPQNASEILISPRAKNLAMEEAVNPADLGIGSGPGGRIIEQDIKAFLAKRPPLTQAAKDELRSRIAAGLPAYPGEEGTGIGGRITAAGVHTAFAAGPAGQKGAAAVYDDEFKDTPIKGIRKIIADQMMKSHATTSPFTLNANALAIKIQELRSRFKNADPVFGLNKITINDLALYAVSRTLPGFPDMNAHKLEGSLRTWKNIHLGVAVSTARGLMVPVLRNADKLTLTGISAKARELAEACRNGSISPDDLHGSTFTITNLGNTGIDSFTPVINIPEVAILGICSILPKPVETSAGKYEILPNLGLSLTVDHAVVDGAPAAVFLKALCQTIQDIDLWIIKESVCQ